MRGEQMRKLMSPISHTVKTKLNETCSARAESEISV